MALRLTLKPGERLIIGGAVMSVALVVPVAARTPGSEGGNRPAFAAGILLSLSALQLLEKLVEPAGHVLRILAVCNRDRICEHKIPSWSDP